MRVVLLLLAACLPSCALLGPQGPAGGEKTSAATPAPAAQAAPPAPPPDPDAPLKAEVAALRERVRASLRAQAEAAWKAWALGEPLALPSDPAVGSAEALTKVRALRDREADPVRKRELAALARLLTGELLGRATAETAEAVASQAATAMVQIDGQDLPLRDLESVLAGEPHTGKRRRVWAAAEPAVRKLEPAVLVHERRLVEALAPLGHASTASWIAELRQVPLAEVAALAERVLASTEAPYRAALEPLGKKEVALALADLRRADAPRLLRTGDVDTYFPKEKSAERLQAALAGLGFDPVALPQLTVDAAPHARKAPRSLALAVEPGKDVRLSFRPEAGLGAAAQALHEAGHAVAWSVLAPGPESAWQAGGAVHEAAGFLFEGLLDDPRFAVRSGVPEVKAAAHGRMSAVRKLFLLRRLAGRVLFEVAFRAGAPKPDEVWREVMARALLFPAGPEDAGRWVAESGDLLAAADDLRGLLAAYQLEAALSAAHGPEWWADPRTAAKLRTWFGSAPATFEEWMVGSVGAPCSPDAAVAALKSRLQAAP